VRPCTSQWRVNAEKRGVEMSAGLRGPAGNGQLNARQRGCWQNGASRLSKAKKKPNIKKGRLRRVRSRKPIRRGIFVLAGWLGGHPWSRTGNIPQTMPGLPVGNR
jgi:hypothetical protein